MAVPNSSPWIAPPAGWAVPLAATFPPPSSPSVLAWASRSRSVPRSIPRKMASSSATTARIREECLAVDQPRDLPQAQAATEAFVQHYNVERPHQGLSCGNRPPRTAFPTLPALPPLPSTIDPDSWLQSLDGLHLERKIDRHGMLSIDLKRYYVSRQLAGHRVSVQLDAQDCCLHVFLQERRVKSLPVRGLLGQVLSFEQFLAHMLQQARAQHRLRSLQERRYRTAF